MDDSLPDVPAGPPGVMVDHLFRSRAGQMVSYLTRLLGPENLDLAEEVVQEALLKALQQWPHSGIPENPAGWLFRVARNAALDAVRHRSMAGKKSGELTVEHLRRAEVEMDHDAEPGELRDDELRMVLMCCHPAISRDARVALSLKTVGGFSAKEIARAFLSDEATIAQRLVRAKRQIREMGLRFEVPAGPDLGERLESALEVIYLMFNEGYTAQAGEDLVRQDLCGEALRLGRLLADSEVATPTVHALIALMAFQAARLPARVDASGDLVLLEEQDRSLWDQRLITLGFHHFSQSAAGSHISAYHIQAAIASMHARAGAEKITDWKTILGLYDQLWELHPTPVVALNRAVALSKVEGAMAALQSLDSLLQEKSLRGYYLLPAVRGNLLLELGEKQTAATCFRAAMELPCSVPERRFLERKLAQCERQAEGPPQ